MDKNMAKELFKEQKNNIISDKTSRIKMSLSNITCRLTHRIQTIEDVYFMDTVEMKPVGIFYCPKCDKRFMANSPNSWFRIILND